MNISTALIVFNMLFDQPNKKHVLIWHQRDRSISRRFIVREKKKKKKNTSGLSFIKWSRNIYYSDNLFFPVHESTCHLSFDFFFKKLLLLVQLSSWINCHLVRQVFVSLHLHCTVCFTVVLALLEKKKINNSFAFYCCLRIKCRAFLSFFFFLLEVN